MHVRTTRSPQSRRVRRAGEDRTGGVGAELPVLDAIVGTLPGAEPAGLVDEVAITELMSTGIPGRAIGALPPARPVSGEPTSLPEVSGSRRTTSTSTTATNRRHARTRASRAQHAAAICDVRVSKSSTQIPGRISSQTRSPTFVGRTHRHHGT